MTKKRRNESARQRGDRLHRELLGPLSGDSHAEEFDGMADTKGNRFTLQMTAEQGGDRGRAARAKLNEWDRGARQLRERDVPSSAEIIAEGRSRDSGTDPFDNDAA